jgi:adenylate cyclase
MDGNEETGSAGRAAAGLTRAELAKLASCPAAELDWLVGLGLIRPDPGGRFAHGDISRVRLVMALLGSGLGRAQLEAAARAGQISVDFAGDMIADAPALTGLTHGEALAAIGLDADEASRIGRALGLPAAAPGDPIREDDRELLALVARARQEGIGEAAILRMLRVFALGIRQIVEAQRDLFRENVEEPLLASGMQRRELLAKTAPLRPRLQRLGYRAVFLILRRLLEQAVFDNAMARLDESLAEQGITRPASADRTIAFIDLSGFTALTEAEGDARAATLGSRFVELVQEAALHHAGRLVKLLGDGAMLHFRRPEDAVAAALAIIAGAPGHGLPPARAGIATGPVIGRDGDYFGRTVNMAARLADAVPAGGIWLDAATAAHAGRPLVPAGRRSLKGLVEPVEVFGLDP